MIWQGVTELKHEPNINHKKTYQPFTQVFITFLFLPADFLKRTYYQWTKQKFEVDENLKLQKNA